jgi:hypothetical protein
MIATLEQKNYFNIYAFSIEDAGVKKKTIKKDGTSEFQVSFEKITTTKTYYTQQNKALLFLSCIFFVAGFISFGASFSDSSVSAVTILVWLFLAGCCLFAYFKTRVYKIYLYTSDNTALIFNRDKPSRQEVESFIDNIIKTRNTNLITKYGNPNRNLQYASQLENLNWLLNVQAMTLDDYNMKVNLLNSLFNTTSGSGIGFTSAKN